MGNFLSQHLSQEGTGAFLLFLWEVCRTISRSDSTQLYGRRRSIVRFIGFLLSKQIKLPPRVTVHPTARRSMFKATPRYQLQPIGKCTLKELEFDQKPMKQVRPDVVADLFPIFEKEDTAEKHKSAKKIADLEQKLNELNSIVQQLLATSNTGTNPVLAIKTLNPPCIPPPPPPPPPPLPPDIPVIPSAKISKSKKKSSTNIDPQPLSMCDILKDMKKVKLRRVERSPGGRPIKQPKTPQPADSLSEILKRRFAAVQLSPESQNETEFEGGDSFKNSFVRRGY